LAPTTKVDIRFHAIGVVHSCFTDRFGIPRQPGLVTAADAWLELYPAYAREEALQGLSGFSHVWLIFVFHTCLGAGWKPTVRPPRLGGRKKVGVFASRSPFRPNPIGISAVELVRIERRQTGPVLHLRGADLLDGTPVLDLKPYVPYADAIPSANAGFAAEPPGVDWAIQFTDEAEHQIALADPAGKRHLRKLIVQILRQDPRPGYMERYPKRTEFGMRLCELEVSWRLENGRAVVSSVRQDLRHDAMRTMAPAE
jgi:tRNA-Thr(GGU) m(6)t(6)A37 methyltransferase TsaA